MQAQHVHQGFGALTHRESCGYLRVDGTLSDLSDHSQYRASGFQRSRRLWPIVLGQRNNRGSDAWQGSDAIYSEDLSHTQDYGGIAVLNPFA